MYGVVTIVIIVNFIAGRKTFFCPKCKTDFLKTKVKLNELNFCPKCALDINEIHKGEVQDTDQSDCLNFCRGFFLFDKMPGGKGKNYEESGEEEVAVEGFFAGIFEVEGGGDYFALTWIRGGGVDFAIFINGL